MSIRKGLYDLGEPSFSPQPRPTGTPDFVRLGNLPLDTALVVKARLLGGRIDTRYVAADLDLEGLAGELGVTFVFRYGVVVTVGPRLTGAVTDSLDLALRRHVVDPTQVQENELVNLVILPGGEDRIAPDGQIHLSSSSSEHLLLAATVLARSVVLSRDEALVSEAFDRVAPLVSDLRIKGRVRLPIRHVMRLIGDLLEARHRVMGTVKANERPDLLWDNPNLDRLYSRLEAEYKINERAEELERKFGALGDFSQVMLDFVQDKRAFRLEAAIIALIAFEILISLFKMAVP